MDIKLRQIVMILVPVGLVLFASLSYGQNDSSMAEEFLLKSPEFLQKQLIYQKELAASWELKGHVELALGILVTLLGAVVAMLQAFKGKKWCSWAVAITGIVISTITFATKEYFEVDQKTYRHSADAARREIRTAEDYLDIIKTLETDSQNRMDMLVEVSNQISKINSIVAMVEKNEPVTLGLIPAANAQVSSRPAWVFQVRSETTTSYRFVGSSTSASVASVTVLALINAQGIASSQLKLPMNIVQRYSRLVQTYLEYNAAQRTYRCFAMVELNKAFVRIKR